MTTYSWQAIGGTVSAAGGGNTATATWTSTGTKQLIVRRVSTVPPYCQGPADTINIIQDIINLNITGYATPCSNSDTVYNCNYTRGEVYDWAIYPNTAGSVVSGNHSPIAHVLWNNVATPTSAQIVVTVHKCDSIKTDTFSVTIQPSPALVIAAVTSPACPGTPVTFTATSGGSVYTWNYGDGTPLATGNPVVHPFPLNTTTGIINYIVRVTATPDPSSGCPISGNATFSMSVLPGPVAYASTAHQPWMCAPFDTALITGTVTNNVTGLTFQWYDVSGGAITGATDTTYSANFVDGFYFIVIASNGCSAHSDTVSFIPRCHASGGSDSTADGYDSSTGGAGCGVLAVRSADTCTTITLDCTTCGTSPVWYAGVMPVSGGAVGGGATWIADSIMAAHVTATYDLPGIYHFTYVANTVPAGCRDTVFKVDTVGVVTNYRYRLRCAGGSSDSVLLTDYTAYLPWWHIDSIAWYDGASYLGSGVTLPLTFTASTTHTITHIVYGGGPRGPFVCEDMKVINVPARPVAAFVDTLSPICEGVPIRFTPTSTGGIVGYDWNFGDISFSLLQNTERTYIWTPPATNPQLRTVTLIITDTIGCSDSVTHDVSIFRNLLAGSYSLGGVICSNAVPFVLSAAATGGTGTPPYTFVWSDSTFGSTLNIYQSGTYLVTIIDAHQCQQTIFPGRNVKVIQAPNAQIYGLQNYCIGQAVNLSGYAGLGVSYAWWRNGSSDGTTPAISDAGLAVGAYQYQLVLGVTDTPTSTTCYDTSAIDSIHVYDLPPAPMISGPTVVDCNTYHLQLTASEAAPWVGTYNWSNGTYDTVNDIYSGGPYRVWFTDMYGCISSSDIYVPLSPDTWFPYFPSGCYALCQQQLPITLPGVPDVTFNYWAWLDNGTAVESGTSSVMSSYVLDSSGNYQWSLDNGLCAKTSDTMEVTATKCATCQGDSFIVNSIVCDLSTPAGYDITIQLYSPGGGSTYTLGTDIGPIDPFSGTLSTFGLQPAMTLAFTTLIVPSPDSVTIEVVYTQPDGSKCVHKQRIALPACGWAAERNGHTPDTTKTASSSEMRVSTALLIYPNPASGELTVSYDYGNDGNTGRTLTVYDQMGRKIESTTPEDVHGTWSLNVANWMPGMYIIRMEGNGKALQTQRVVISH